MMTCIYSAALIIFFCIMLFAARSEWERRQLKIEYYRAECKRPSVASEATENNALRIAYISDVHDYLSFGSMTDRLIEAVRSQSPEIVVLGGDIITVRGGSGSAPDTKSAEQLAAGLSADFTVLYAPGNHETRFREKYTKEYEAYRAELEQTGVIFLGNSFISAGDVRIYAVEPEMAYYRKLIPFIGEKKEMPEKYLIGRLGIPDRRYFNILLIHTPLYLKEASQWGADLVLSGHFHGGTVRLPGGRGLMSPQYQFFSKECSGIHSFGSTDMIVSRGLGTHTFHIRFNDLPELRIVDIVKNRK